jgi:hypothetical protein
MNLIRKQDFFFEFPSSQGEKGNKLIWDDEKK